MSMQEIFSLEDLEQLQEHGISMEEAMSQIAAIRDGFPYLDIVSSASLEQGIMRVENEQVTSFLNVWEHFLSTAQGKVYKMVPASGAASRMFKDLYSFMDAGYSEPRTDAEKTFFTQINNFAFFDRLNEACLRNEWKPISKLIEAGKHKNIVDNLINEKGLNYGNLPKGLLLFHAYPKSKRTAAEEHLAEGALYAKQKNGKSHVHFTVSPEHRDLFKALIDKSLPAYTEYFGVIFEVTYSEQKASTDTLALTEDNTVFRKSDGSILFRPGGHGALISNLNDLPDADVVFIKNIDNVVPDYYKSSTIINKKLLGGILVQACKETFGYLRILEREHVSRSELDRIADYLSDIYMIKHPDRNSFSDEELKAFLFEKLNRPVRVCGMVRNEGEPGGGPFVVREPDGSTSLQILESTQIDMNRPDQKALFEEGRFFNPVDLVCNIKDYKGKKFDLQKFVNPKTAFISNKSSDGRALKALERPGLWNGAMHHWNTIFVEVPINTFNPVKTVNDLLRSSHQAALKK